LFGILTGELATMAHLDVRFYSEGIEREGNEA
jgi:hypothetical protein